MGRSPITKSESDDGLKKGPWTKEEDELLINYIQKHGQGSWQLLPTKAGLNRCGKSCRLRWTNYLRPDIKRGNFSPQEEHIIIDLHASLGNKWSMIAAHLPGRTDNEIKNFWNTHIRKKLIRSGIDPRTHQPITDFSFLGNYNTHPMMSGYNYNSDNINPMNPLEGLAKIGLLRNLLQVLMLNSNPILLPSLISGGNSENIPNRFNGTPDHGIMSSSTPLQVPGLENVVPTPSYGQPVLDDFRMITELVRNVKNNGEVISHARNGYQTENGIPGLVPTTPEISSGDQVHGVSSSEQIQNYDDKVFVSNNHSDDVWGTTGGGDDEENIIGSFWNDVFDESFLPSVDQ